jgi:hypothetical protein
LDLRIFSLSGENAAIQLQKVTLFHDSIAIPSEGSHFLLAPGQMHKLELHKSPVTIYAPRWPISVRFVSGVESFEVDLILRRQKATWHAIGSRSAIFHHLPSVMGSSKA